MRQKAQFDLARVVALLSVGVGSVASIGLFIALGYFLDRHIGTTPLFTLIGLFVGGAGVFYSLYRHMMAALDARGAQNQEGSDRPNEEGSESTEETRRNR